MIELVVLLGNPGFEYIRSRHNIAWQMIEFLSFYSEMNWKHKFKGQYAVESVGDRKIFFLKPETYMNRSGESVYSMVDFYDINPEDLLVVHAVQEIPM